MSTFEHLLSSVFAVPSGTIDRYGSRFAPQIRDAVYAELLRIHFATSTAFRKIRSSGHLFRMATVFYRLFEQVPLKARDPDRFCRCSIFRSSLLFPFGKKPVLCLGILISSLNVDERLDHQHIEAACRRLVPTITAIPSSFCSHIYPDENCTAIYLELEGEHCNPIPTAELMRLQKNISSYIKESIEKVASYVYLPTNEDETLRNCALLAREVFDTESLPQIMIHYHGEASGCLVFGVTLVRPVQASEVKQPPALSKSPVIDRTEVVQITNVEAIPDSDYVKQAIVLYVHVKKEPFLRCDRSIDFLQARKVLVFCLRESLGDIRDLNGGLLDRQRDLFEEVNKALRTISGYNARICENIYYSIVPSLLKSLSSAEQLTHFFRLFFQMRSLPYGRRSKAILQTHTAAISAYLLVKTSHIHSESIFSAAQKAGLQEYEFALAFDTIEDHECIGILIISKNTAAKNAFGAWLDTVTKCQEETLSEKRKIRISLPLTSMQFDPRISSERPTGTIIKLLFEGLFRLSNEGKSVPAVAEKVKILDQGKTYVFTLRPTLWSNGQPVTAMDFEYSWKKILDPSFQTYFNYFFSPIKNADEAKRGLVDPSEIGISSKSDRELVVQLKYPEPHFLDLCSHWMYSPMCRTIDQENPGWAHLVGSQFVCNGPFIPAHWSSQGDVRVVKNPLFWNERAVTLEEIEVCVLEDALAALQQFNRGYLDWIGDPLSDVSADVLTAAPGALHSYSENALFWFEFDCQAPPFRSKKVRKAFSLSIDRKKIVSSSQDKHNKVATSILPETFSLHDATEDLQYNVEKAKRLFQEGLLEQNISPSSLMPLTLCISDTRNHEEIAMQSIEMWKQAFGISIILDKRPVQGFFDSLRQKEAQILGRRWCLWHHDPLYTLNMLQQTNTGIGITHWNCEEYSKLINKAREETESSKKSVLLKHVEACALDEMPISPILEYVYHYKKNENLQDAYPSSMAGVDFSYATLRQKSYEKVLVQESDFMLKKGLELEGIYF